MFFNKIFALNVLCVSSLLIGCSGGINNDLREANNSFRYLNEEFVARDVKQPANTDALAFSNRYSIPEPITDVRAALLGKQVDIRPPQKIISLSPNVEVFRDGDLAQLWFYPVDKNHVTSINDMLSSVFHLLKDLHVDIEDIDLEKSVIRTDWYEANEFVYPYSTEDLTNESVRYRQRYAFLLLQNSQGVPGVTVQLTDNEMEYPDGSELRDGLTRFEPARFSALMANRLLEVYYKDQQKLKDNAQYSSLEISLGRDNNNQPCWLVNISFDEAYNLLQSLFVAYDITIKEYSSSTGEIKVDYDEFEPEDWDRLGVESWGIDSAIYQFKIGVVGDKTSITLYDKHDKPVPTGIVARMYSGFSASLNKQFLDNKYNKSTKKD